MRIIIAGAGSVGFHLAELLTAESHDIVLIDTSKDRLEYAESHLDISAVRGDSTSFAVLDQAGITDADLLIAVTSLGDTNITTAIIGKRMGAKKTIVRIKNMEYLIDKSRFDLREVGIDALVSPESLAAREIRRLLKESAVTDSFDFEDGKLSLIGLYVTDKAPIIGKTLIETRHLNPKNNFITVALQRDGEEIIPRGKTEFKLNDHVYFITRADSIEEALIFTGNKRVEINNVMVLGGSRTGAHIARRMSNGYNIKLIDKDRKKAISLAEELDNVMVINGDGTDIELLDEEGIDYMDAFVAVTGNSETNILSCLVAKNRGVKKTIALIENREYIKLSENFGIDAMINKKIIAANFMFKYIREGDVVSLTGIYGMDAEILEFNVTADCLITKEKIKDLKFPEKAIIGGVIRDDVGFITLGDFQIQEGDKVVVFTMSKGIKQVEKFFKRR
ncbi:MAG: trk system potassium uptake protein TrkA [Sphingobacteriales bacterium]|jgi:trk system potassium uptake protein TrkA